MITVKNLLVTGVELVEGVSLRAGAQVSEVVVLVFGTIVSAASASLGATAASRSHVGVGVAVVVASAALVERVGTGSATCSHEVPFSVVERSLLLEGHGALRLGSGVAEHHSRLIPLVGEGELVR